MWAGARLAQHGLAPIQNSASTEFCAGAASTESCAGADSSCAGLRWRWAALLRWAALGSCAGVALALGCACAGLRCALAGACAGLRWAAICAGAALALGCAGAGLRWRWLRWEESALVLRWHWAALALGCAEPT